MSYRTNATTNTVPSDDGVLTLEKLMATMRSIPSMPPSPIPTVFSLDPRLPRNRGVITNRKGDAVGVVAIDEDDKVEFLVLSEATDTRAALGFDLYERVMTEINTQRMEG